MSSCVGRGKKLPNKVMGLGYFLENCWIKSPYGICRSSICSRVEAASGGGQLISIGCHLLRGNVESTEIAVRDLFGKLDSPSLGGSNNFDCSTPWP